MVSLGLSIVGIVGSSDVLMKVLAKQYNEAVMMQSFVACCMMYLAVKPAWLIIVDLTERKPTPPP